MPIHHVTRLASTAPRVGDVYGSTDGGRAFAGIVVAIKKLGSRHVTVAIELDESEHKRLLLGEGKAR